VTSFLTLAGYFAATISTRTFVRSSSGSSKRLKRRTIGRR
jgi:hypothetical protein